jgi:hypothetical protein
MSHQNKKRPEAKIVAFMEASELSQMCSISTYVWYSFKALLLLGNARLKHEGKNAERKRDSGRLPSLRE